MGPRDKPCMLVWVGSSRSSYSIPTAIPIVHPQTYRPAGNFFRWYSCHSPHSSPFLQNPIQPDRLICTNFNLEVHDFKL